MSNTRFGALMMVVAALHTVVALAVGWPVWAQMLGDGLLGTAGPSLSLWASEGFVASASARAPEAVIFWFLLAGVPLFVAGQLARRVERPLPRWIGVELVALGLLCGLALPLSGFWLLVALGAWQALSPPT